MIENEADSIFLYFDMAGNNITRKDWSKTLSTWVDNNREEFKFENEDYFIYAEYSGCVSKEFYKEVDLNELPIFRSHITIKNKYLVKRLKENGISDDLLPYIQEDNGGLYVNSTNKSIKDSCLFIYNTMATIDRTFDLRSLIKNKKLMDFYPEFLEIEEASYIKRIDVMESIDPYLDKYTQYGSW